MKIIFLLFLLPTKLLASSPTDISNQWQTLLTKHINISGGVDYLGFEKDLSLLDAFLQQYKNLDTQKLSDSEKTALYINLYNAQMIRNILRYATDNKIGVKDPSFTKLKINGISTGTGNIWNSTDKKYQVNLHGQWINLDQIEHGLIRGQADDKLKNYRVSKLDPRIHTAVNCGAKSCPRVREVAYSGENLDAELTRNIQSYVSSPQQFKKLTESKMRANSIVFWYYGDFDDTAQDIMQLKGAGDYLSQYLLKGAQDGEWKKKHFIENFNDRSRFSLKLSSSFDFYYDWTINDKRNY